MRLVLLHLHCSILCSKCHGHPQLKHTTMVKTLVCHILLRIAGAKHHSYACPHPSCSWAANPLPLPAEKHTGHPHATCPCSSRKLVQTIGQAMRVVHPKRVVLPGRRVPATTEAAMEAVALVVPRAEPQEPVVP